MRDCPLPGRIGDSKIRSCFSFEFFYRCSNAATSNLHFPMEGEKNEGRGSFLLERVVPPRSLKREADDESRSAVAGLDGDRTVVLFDDLLRDEETEAGTTLTFGGEERIENLLYVWRRDAGARIGYRDPHDAGFHARRNRESAFLDIRHGVGGVLQQVHDGLNHLPPIDIDQRWVGIQVNLHVDILASQVRLNESQRVGNQFGSVAALGAASSLPAEIEHPLGHFFDATRRPVDHFEIDPKRMIGRQALLDESHVAANEHERIRDLVGKTRGKLADRDQA